MATARTSEAATRQRLLDAADRLLNERGVAVSTRDITGEAGANSAAIHYHFGSKEALLRELVGRRAESVLQLQDTYLMKLEGSRPTVRDVAEAIVQPFAQYAHGDSGKRRTQLPASPTMMPLYEDVFAEQHKRYITQLQRALPETPVPRLEMGLAMAFQLAFRCFFSADDGPLGWATRLAPAATEQSPEEVVTEFLESGLIGISR